MPFSDWKTRPPEPPPSKPESEPPSVWRRWRRRFLVALLVLLVVVGGSLYSTYQATQQTPDFYKSVMAEPLTVPNAPPIREVAKQQLKEVQIAAKTKTSWRFEFSQDQINQFLAKDLPEQAPHLLPSNLKDPRIKIEEGKALLGCHYDSERFKAVLWVETEAQVTDDGKSIRLIPKSAGAGALPMPISRLFERLKGLNATTGAMKIELSEVEPQSVLITLREAALPPEQANYHIDAIKLEPKKLSLEGSFSD